MIRPFVDGDLDQLLDVWFRASKVGHPFLDDEFLATERELIANEWIPSAETTVYERDGRVVGFVSVVGDEIGGLFVDPHHQREGIGRSLVDHVVTGRAHVELDVFEENSSGRSFYEGYGFDVTGSSVHEPTGRVQLRMRLG